MGMGWKGDVSLNDMHAGSRRWICGYCVNLGMSTIYSKDSQPLLKDPRMLSSYTCWSRN